MVVTEVSVEYEVLLVVVALGSPYRKGKVFYFQEPPRGESTTTERGVNYQLLEVIY